MKSNFLIAAPSSGQGKTTITLGLLRALKNRKLKVQSFKCGPDYIDPKYHTLATGKPSINLDSYLSSAHHIKDLYSSFGKGADVCVAEGMMGMFDGYKGMLGSSAEISSIIKTPVILVVNAKATSYSVAPLIYGFKNFNKDINVIGVIFNKVGSEAHYNYLLEACKDAGVISFGYLPNNKDIEVPSRHLGLTLEEEYTFDQFADKIAALVEEHIDIDKLLEATQTNDITDESEVESKPEEEQQRNLKIAVAQDEAFNFIYQTNINQLKKLGKVTFFSPIHDKEMPEADLLYLPGGYPEYHIKALSENKSMLHSIHQHIEENKKVLAECGGMMYLCNSIVGMNNENYPVVGALQQTATMQKMKLSLGYRNFTYNGIALRGHEFHYSAILPEENPLESVADFYGAKGNAVKTKLYRYKNVIAGYTHLYWGEINLLDLWND